MDEQTVAFELQWLRSLPSIEGCYQLAGIQAMCLKIVATNLQSTCYLIFAMVLTFCNTKVSANGWYQFAVYSLHFPGKWVLIICGHLRQCISKWVLSTYHFANGCYQLADIFGNVGSIGCYQIAVYSWFVFATVLPPCSPPLCICTGVLSIGSLVATSSWQQVLSACSYPQQYVSNGCYQLAAY